MDQSFREFADHYYEVWRSSSIDSLRNIIAEDYQGREINGGKPVDFGFGESVSGWEQGFTFVKENNAKWVLEEIATFTLRTDEVMMVVSATMDIGGKRMDTGNVLFQTFKKDGTDEWKLVRSYIEAGIPAENLGKVHFS
ncbi:flavoprotein [Alteribacter natronophilus]|uniref:flavoprotein n=1 Tax=Alteribacter natronophilus TaxID=2583810 RepID=UPI00110F201C|nr:flavoprotein [Alteribacter natronophilus]TMW71458.1 flavoprotein [Alteribacter natronophilus]